MKRILSGLIVILIFLSMVACSSEKEITFIKDGTYVLEQIGEDKGVFPCVTILEGNITFTYDYLSSYLPIGTYIIENDILTMKTDDGKYEYVFKIDGDMLVFQKKDSSDVTLTDEKIGIKIKDDVEFKLIENK